MTAQENHIQAANPLSFDEHERERICNFHDNNNTELRQDAAAKNKDEKSHDQREVGSASVTQTITNMSKTCMGTGCLALPFAAKQGGILLHVFGLAGIGLWNVIMVQRLCLCYNIISDEQQQQQQQQTPDGITMSLEDGSAAWNVLSNQQRQSLRGSEEETLPLKRLGTSLTNSCGESSSRCSYQSLLSEAPSPADESNWKNSDNHLSERSNTVERSTRTSPPEGAATLTKLTWYALGSWGANTMDVIMVLYLLGVVVTYMNAMRSFLSDTCFTTGVGFLDSIVLVALMGPLSVVPHTGHLAKASAMGLMVLFATFAVIAWYGFLVSGESSSWHVLTGDEASLEMTTSATSHNNDHPIAPSVETMNDFWFPHNGIQGVSVWFGCIVFGFGIVPLTFNFREAMKEPHKLVRPATWGPC
jgi:hypothetical protein